MSVSVNGHTYRTDCSGLVSACYGEAGHPIDDELPPAESATEALWLRFRRAAVGVAKVRAGDLAFFHNTYDRNGNGLRDDRFTHVALVASVDADGTVHFVHYASGEVRLDVMNLRHKADARDPRRGKVWNSYLRRGGGKVLAGQLFFRFVRVIR
jgi:cell wall-associated NlpC family hydrolase